MIPKIMISSDPSCLYCTIIKERYEHLLGITVATNAATTFANTSVKHEVKCSCHTADLYVAHSSSGLGHRPLKAETTGSNPVCATTLKLEKR